MDDENDQVQVQPDTPSSSVGSGYVGMSVGFPTNESSLQNDLNLVKRSIEVSNLKQNALNQDVTSIRASFSKFENRLGPLQKMVASQTDKALDLKKDFGEFENSVKLQLQQIQTKIQEQGRDIEAIKLKQTDVELKVNSIASNNQQNSTINVTTFGNTSQPSGDDNGVLTQQQMLDAVERQLGIYDVKIAEMEIKFQVLERTSTNGILIWKIPDYARRKREAINGRTLSLYSQPFYTSKYGYKMCARIYLNGDGMGKGTHISLFFVVMKGEFDTLLPWPFRQKVTMMLLDQGSERRHLSDTFRPDPTSSSFKKPTSDMNIASGCPLFVPHSVLNGSSYVVEDSIFVRIQVDTSDGILDFS